MVIVEYCRFGNLQTFLVKHRAHFVDQVDKKSDQIDQNINMNELRWSENNANGYNRYILRYFCCYICCVICICLIYVLFGFKFPFFSVFLLFSFYN